MLNLYGDQMLAYETYARTLLSSPYFYAVNLCNPDDASRLVSKLVRLDRLPQYNSLQGLLLLQSAWCKYDVCMYLAQRYKLVCKVS